jgi:hypothetical protein
MLARLEIGEVLLTASIDEIKRQIVLGVMPWNIAARDEIGKGISGGTGKLASLSKWKDALGVKGNCEFAFEARFDLRDREPETVCHGFGDVEVKGQGAPACYFDSTLL